MVEGAGAARAQPRWRRARWRDGYVWLVAVATSLATYPLVLAGRVVAPMDVLLGVSPWSNRVPTESISRIQTDLVELAPNQERFWDALRQGDLLTYDWAIAGGVPLSSMPITGLASPFSWPRLLVDPATADTLRVLLPLVAAQVGTFYLLRRLGVRVVPALAAGVAYAFCGSAASWTGRVVPLFVLPAMLLAVDLVVRGTAPRRASALLVLTALVALTEGYLPGGIYSLLLAGCYAVALAVSRARREGAPGRPAVRAGLGGLVRAGACVAVAGALCAWQLLPYRQLASASGWLGLRDFDRTARLPVQDALGWLSTEVTGSIVPDGWARLGVNPVRAGSLVGGLVLGAAAVALVRLVRGHRPPERLALLLTVLTGATALLTVLSYLGTPLLDLWYAVPVLGDASVFMTRFIINLTFVVLAAAAWDLRRPGEAPAAGVALRAGSALCLAVCTWTLALGAWALLDDLGALPSWEVNAYARALSVAVATALFAAVALRRGARAHWHRPLVAAGVLAALWVQLAVPFLGYLPQVPRDAHYPGAPGMAAVRAVVGDQERLLATALHYYPNATPLYGIPDARGHAMQYEPYRDVVELAAPDASRADKMKVIVTADGVDLDARALDELSVGAWVQGLRDGPRGARTRTAGSPVALQPVSDGTAVELSRPPGGDLDALSAGLRADGEGCETTLVRLAYPDGTSSAWRRMRDTTDVRTIVPTWFDTGPDGGGATGGTAVVRTRALDGAGGRCSLGLQVDAAGAAAGEWVAAPGGGVVLASAEDSWIYERPSALPVVTASTRWTCVPDRRTGLDLLRDRPRSATGAVLTRGCPDGPGTPRGGGYADVRFLERGDAEVELATDAATTAVVEYRVNDWPGWRVTVDGEPAQLLQSNGTHLAVAVPAGSHRVRFTYAPAALRVGAWLGGAGLVGLAALLLPLPRRRRDPHGHREGRRRSTAGPDAGPDADPRQGPPPGDDRPVGPAPGERDPAPVPGP